MPLTGIAAIGAVVTPMAVLTSCNKTTVSKLEVDASKAKTEYYWGNKINTDGLVIKATMSDKSTKTIAAKDCKFTPSLETGLTLENDSVIVEFGGQKATYNIAVYEDILTFGWRENPREGEGEISLNDAADAYFTEGNVKANIKDDIFWHLSYYARLVQALFKIEAESSTPQDISKAIQEIIGFPAFIDVGVFDYAKGTVKNLVVDYKAAEHKAYLSADIIMKLKSDLNNREDIIDGKATKIEKTGDYTLEVTYHINNLPYHMEYYEPEGGFLAYPDRGVLVGAKTPLTNDWSISHEIHGFAKYLDQETPITADITTTWNKANYIDPNDQKSCPAGNPLNFISWASYYLENYTWNNK